MKTNFQSTDNGEQIFAEFAEKNARVTTLKTTLKQTIWKGLWSHANNVINLSGPDKL